MTAKRSSLSPPRRLADDRRGNVAMMWALGASVTLGLVGLSVDFSRANASRQVIQNAADGAALVAERMAERPFAERQQAAENYFRASITGTPYASSASISITEMPDGGHEAQASIPVPTTLSRLVQNRDFLVRTSATADQAGTDLEVALILDTTGSMSGRMNDLKAAAVDLVNIVVNDEQTPYYSRVALIPYSQGVNLLSDADEARGPIAAGEQISGADWRAAAATNISAATRTNPVVVTANGHALSTGDRVYIASVNGMTQIRNKQFTVGAVTASTFQLAGINGTSYSNYTSGGTVTKCKTSACEVVVTNAGSPHQFVTNDKIFITGVAGMTQINNAANTVWTVTKLDTHNFVLNGTNGPTYNNYTGSGMAYCTVSGCEYFRFTNPSGNQRVHRVSTCVSERVGPQAFTNVGPGVAYVGLNYPATNNPCPATALSPLSSDKGDLATRINALTPAGTTAGHIGLAWGWYALTPSFGSLWSGEGVPAARSDSLRKVAVLMTDGEFNTMYCNGVISNNSTAGSSSDRINCPATNGTAFAQTAEYCNAMKGQGITIYTVGFDVGSSTAVRNALRDCASGPANAHLAATGAELREVFQKIGTSISLLRLTK